MNRFNKQPVEVYLIYYETSNMYIENTVHMHSLIIPDQYISYNQMIFLLATNAYLNLIRLSNSWFFTITHWDCLCVDTGLFGLAIR